MTTVIGILCTSLWLLYGGQALSVVNREMAVRLRLQDYGGDPNNLTHRLEMWTARFDLLTLWTLPTAGVLMLIDHPWWPYAAMIGGGAYIDGLGRYMFAILALREKGVWTGTPGEWLATKIIFLPVIVLRTAPAFFPQIDPALEDSTDAEVLQILNWYYLASAALVFVSFLFLKLSASRTYAAALLSNLRA